MLSSLQTYLGGLVMGNHWSNQFLRALSQGNPKRASELYANKPYLKENMESNQSLGAEHHGNTYLHYAAFYGMEDMYQDLLRLNGKPDMKNSERRNCLHMICLGQAVGDKTKYEMLELTFKEGLKGMDLEHLLGEKDENGDTALHLAAGAGCQECVELLVSYKADMVATNEKGQTPADAAKAMDHSHIATNLEAKMVFSNEGDDDVIMDPDPELLQEIADAPIGMHDRDLRSMKDALLINTSEMLGVSLQSAEVLLRNHGWSKEALLQAWVENPQSVCAEAGVDVVPLDEGGQQDYLAPPPPPPPLPPAGDVMVCDVGGGDGGVECGICCVSGCTDHQVLLPCGHYFCQDCWKQYLEEKIGGGQSEAISCPEYGCYKLVPLEVIEGVVSQEMALKFLSFDIKAFVDSNPNIRWCPRPGCSQAVSQAPPLEDHAQLSPSHSHEAESGSVVKGRTVHCGAEHYFCWDCLGEAHEPSSCAQWKAWLDHCEEMKEHVGDTSAAEADEAASSKWLAHNSKPCPKCSSPIEKTEGCNHMCCKKCRHDFCWVCLDDWKCHNSSTGGYFNCNRYDAQRKASNILFDRQQQVARDNAGWERISKFLHFYERYKEHINSLMLEEPFLNKAQEKMVELAQSIQHMEHSAAGLREGPPGAVARQLNLSFIGNAVQELLKCRRVLKATYCYGYYLTGVVSTKQFEHMQGALEQVTEMLAEAVARPHLRKPRQEIIRLTWEGREKRTGLIKNVRSGLPLSHHPFGGRGLSFGSATSSSDADARHRRFLRDLDTYTPPERKWPRPNREPHRHRQQHNEDQDLMRVMEISREEYEADKQMLADVERAKNLSLLDPNHKTPSIDHLTPSIDHLTPSQNHLTSSIDHLTPSQNHLTPSQNHLTPSQNHLTSSINHLTPSLTPPPPSLLLPSKWLDRWSLSSSGSDTMEADRDQRLSWDADIDFEENLRRATEESLNTLPPPSLSTSATPSGQRRHTYSSGQVNNVMTTRSPPHRRHHFSRDNMVEMTQFSPAQDTKDTSPELPPTLRQMFLDNSERLGTNV